LFAFLQFPFTFFLSGPNILFIAQFSTVLPLMWKTRVICVLIFTVLASRRGEWRSPELNLILISSWMQFWFVFVVLKYKLLHF
jgi:hypothetical protein